MPIHAPSIFGGWWAAANFAYGLPGGPSSLMVQGTAVPASPAVAQSLQVAFGYTTTVDGIVFYPLATNASINIGTDGNFEAVTPASVTGNGSTTYQGVSFTADFADAHGSGDAISSATIGLQEAINLAHAAGGGKVVVDEQWTHLGGTTAMVNTATGTLPSGVTIVDNR